MVVGLTAKQWRGLVDATGLGPQVQALAAQLGVDLRAEGERFKAREALAALFGPWIAARTLAEVARAFEPHGVCWTPYQTVGQLVHDDPACSTANPMFSTIHQPGVGPLLVPGLPLSFSALPRSAPRPAPVLGQHTEQVLTEVLGLNTAALGGLAERKVIGLPA